MNRIIGIDLLKIISMMLIVSLHVLGYGGAIPNNNVINAPYLTTWFLEIISLTAVDTFGLITGYLYIDKKININSIFKLWIKVLFYSLLIYIIFLLFNSNHILNLTSILKYCFPLVMSHYWYFTHYFALFFFIPFINRLLNILDRKQYSFLCILIGFLFFIMNTIRTMIVFPFSLLLVLYIIGGYIKRFVNITFNNKKLLLIFFVVVFCNLLFRMFFIKATTVLFKNPMGGLFTKNESPTILFQSVLLLLIFRNVEIKSDRLNMSIKYLSKLSFSVYLIHAHELVLNNLITNSFIFLSTINNPILIIIHWLAIVISITFVCLTIDALVEFFFNRIGIYHLIDRKLSYYNAMFDSMFD